MVVMLAILEDNIDVLKLNADIVEVLKKKKDYHLTTKLIRVSYMLFFINKENFLKMEI